MAAFACLATAAVLGTVGLRANQTTSDLQDARLQSTAEQATTQMTQTLERARVIDLMIAREPSFAQYVADPRPAAQKVLDDTGPLGQIHDTLRYLTTIFPVALDDAGFVTTDGREVARFGNGRFALAPDLGSVANQSFFKAAMALQPGAVYRSVPEISPVSGAYVITEATQTQTAGGKPGGVAYFSLTLDSFRTGFVNAAVGDQQVRMIDQSDGKVLLDSKYLQDSGAGDGSAVPVRPEDLVFTTDLAAFRSGSGTQTLDGQRLSYATVLGEDASVHGGWVVVASQPAQGLASAFGGFGAAVVGLFVLGSAPARPRAAALGAGRPRASDQGQPHGGRA